MFTGRRGGNGGDKSATFVLTGDVAGFEGARGAAGGGRNNKLLTADDGGRVRSTMGTSGIDERGGERRGVA